jgi:hypothetical protein
VSGIGSHLEVVGTIGFLLEESSDTIDDFI